MSTQTHTVNDLPYRTDVVQTKGPNAAFLFFRATAYAMDGERVVVVGSQRIEDFETLSIPTNAMGDQVTAIDALRARVLARCVAHRAAAEQLEALGIPKEGDVGKPSSAAPAPLSPAAVQPLMDQIAALTASLQTLQATVDTKADQVTVDAIAADVDVLKEAGKVPEGPI